MKGAPRDLLPGDPVCAPVRTVLAEASVALVRSLSEYPLWRDHIASSILKGLQEIRSAALLRSGEENVLSSSFSAKQQGFTEDENKEKMQVRTRQNISLLQKDWLILKVVYGNVISKCF